MNTETLIQKSPVVVYGKVVQILVQEGSGRQLAVFQSKDQIRGKNNGDFYIPVHYRFLKDRGEIEFVSGAPDFKLGEELLLFLDTIPKSKNQEWGLGQDKNMFRLEGFFQGKYRIMEDRFGVRRALRFDQEKEAPVGKESIRSRQSTARLSLKSESIKKIKGEAKNYPTLTEIANRVRGLGR